MPPRQRPPRRTPRSVIYRRRFAAIAVLIAGFAIAWFAVASIKSGGGTKAKPPTTPLPPKPFRVVFPEGFTRAQMAERVGVVAKIAQRERGHKPKLAAKTYLAATNRPRFIPGFGSHPLEGFLFPATYDFTDRKSTAQPASRPLQAIPRSWRN